MILIRRYFRFGFSSEILMFSICDAKHQLFSLIMQMSLTQIQWSFHKVFATLFLKKYPSRVFSVNTSYFFLTFCISNQVCCASQKRHLSIGHAAFINYLSHFWIHVQSEFSAEISTAGHTRNRNTCFSFSAPTVKFMHPR